MKSCTGALARYYRISSDTRHFIMTILLRHFSLIITASILFSVIHAQQVADPNFDAKVAYPAYAKNGPKVLFDETHNNFHTASGRYNHSPI
jgi:hypothetical protein